MFLVLLQIILAKISLKNNKIRNLFDGKPSIIINRGKVNFKEMVKQRYNLDDLLTQLREKQIRSIEEVDYAILETSGRLSVFIKGTGEKNELIGFDYYGWSAAHWRNAADRSRRSIPQGR